MKKVTEEAALRYHEDIRPGKIEIMPTKAYSTQYDLSLAYSPGVAYPCEAIKERPEDAYKYTNKGNLVAVISNGTAVLGLRDIGALAGKPVMEGKALLFKVFGGIDAFDVEIDEHDIDKFVDIVTAISPSFGAINLEDIKAPECFEIERRLKERLSIPIMHDDQHGTAIISGAALLNSLELQGKNIEDIKLVVNGAGAAALACTNFFITLGVRRENVIMCDSSGMIVKSRTDLNKYKRQFAVDLPQGSLADAMVGADVFLGVSVRDVVTESMIMDMAPNPIVLALANPDPEITYEKATDLRDDIIVATGRSDYPNQVNNLLGFPYIFRGALDCGATGINEAMKISACKAIAALAHKPVPKEVENAYGKEFKFGKYYILPKPLDPRLLIAVSPEVAKAADKSGIARRPIRNWDKYTAYLKEISIRDKRMMMCLANEHINNHSL